MSDSVWPHRWQPTRLSRPWDSPGKNMEWVAISFSNAWKWKVKVNSLSPVWLVATPWTAAYQAPLSMGFSRQEYWSGVPLPSPCIVWSNYYQKQKHTCRLLSKEMKTKNKGKWREVGKFREDRNIIPVSKGRREWLEGELELVRKGFIFLFISCRKKILKTNLVYSISIF